MDIGITGTRKGLTNQQKDYLRTWFKNAGGMDTLRHGDCVGADAEAHDIARPFTQVIVIHPPEDSKLRAFKEAEIVHPPKPYLERNLDIVERCQILLAFPDSKREKKRSGTWATVRMARQRHRAHIIVYPDGSRKMS